MPRKKTDDPRLRGFPKSTASRLGAGQQVADLAQQLDVLGRRRRRGRRLGLRLARQLVDRLDQQENRKGDDQELITALTKRPMFQVTAPASLALLIV